MTSSFQKLIYIHRIKKLAANNRAGDNYEITKHANFFLNGEPDAISAKYTGRKCFRPLWSAANYFAFSRFLITRNQIVHWKFACTEICVWFTPAHSFLINLIKSLKTLLTITHKIVRFKIKERRAEKQALCALWEFLTYGQLWLNNWSL